MLRGADIPVILFFDCCWVCITKSVEVSIVQAELQSQVMVVIPRLHKGSECCLEWE